MRLYIMWTSSARARANAENQTSNRPVNLEALQEAFSPQCRSVPNKLFLESPKIVQNYFERNLKVFLSFMHGSCKKNIPHIIHAMQACQDNF